jgi:cobalt/nickel transport system ATP-binding protein
MDKYLLEFEQVYYTYPGTQQSVLNGLNIKIPCGKNCALIGQNGCGKTTLFLLANGLYKPDRGIIKWLNEPLRYNKNYLTQLRQKIGLVFQDPEHQLVASTVEEDISYGLCNLGLSPAEIKIKVENILDELDLMNLAEKPVHHLSLGQKKRVSIADIMVLEPQLLVLDEPTAYLDIKHSRNLISTLKKIHDGGTTLLMATHDLDLVYRWADWVFVMDEGQLILEGTPEDVFSQHTVLEELELGVPFIYEMLLAGLSVEEKAVLTRVKERIFRDLQQI